MQKIKYYEFVFSTSNSANQDSNMKIVICVCRTNTYSVFVLVYKPLINNKLLQSVME